MKVIRITTISGSLKVLLKGQFKFMKANGLKIIGVASGYEDLEEVKVSEGIDVVEINMSRKITPFNDIRSLLLMYKFLKKEQPQIVHTHTPKAGIVGMLAAKLAGVPIRLHTVAGLPLMEASGGKRKLLDFVEKVTYACATKVYPNSKGLHDFILEEGYTSQDKLNVIGNGSSNGIDTSFFAKENIPAEHQDQLKKELQIHANDFVFVFVGRLVGDKGINELVEAFSKFKTQNSKLLLVGPLESDLDPLLPETLKEIETNQNIISVGFQKDVRPYFVISNALVFPSYREGFPNVVMQAGAMELPCIVSNINGCNEIVVEGENGTIIPVKDAEAITVAMQKLMEDKDYYLSLKNNARPMIQARYEQSVVWNALLDEYNMLIKKLDIKN